ncbi:MAG: hypothetical protein RL745_786 [Actinomycetota bacterium]|jgi:peptidoglycan/LPS O-acetylase OafA/YrhL
MSAEIDHGSTPASWTAVIVMLVGMLIAGIAMILKQPTYFWVGMAIIPVGAAAGWVMAKAGLGQQRS